MQNRKQHSEGTHTTPFLEGMAQFSLLKRTNALTLCALAAACGCGILIGTLLFLFAGIPSDIAELKALYLAARAFCAYETPRAYLSFFAGWYINGLLWLIAAVFCGMTVRPRVFSALLCFARALLAGFGIATLAGRFSVFLLFYAAMQSAFLVWLMLLCTKASRYADRRAVTIQKYGSDALLAKPFLWGVLLPLWANLLLLAFALALGMLCLSALAGLLL